MYHDKPSAAATTEILKELTPKDLEIMRSLRVAPGKFCESLLKIKGEDSVVVKAVSAALQFCAPAA